MKVLFSLVVLMVIAVIMTVITTGTEAFDIDAESAILLDSETGKILFQKNVDDPFPPASMSKMMTEYLVLEAVIDGNLEWDTVTQASAYAHYLGGLDNTSRVWLAQGEQRTVEELYKALAIYSANDATVALAELVGGSEEAFVGMMNDRAAEFGMSQTHFVNTTGLPNRMLGNFVSVGGDEDENLMSARDTAILAKRLLNDYPEVLRFSSVPYESPDYSTVDLVNWNWMLMDHPRGEARPYAYEGLDGLKTGFTNLAGYTFTGTAERDGMRLISVVMRSESNTSRFVETARLLDYGFTHFQYEQVVEDGMILDGWLKLPVSKGIEQEASIAISGDIRTLIHEDEVNLYSLEFVPDTSYFNQEDELIAPVDEGTVIGEVQLIYNGTLPQEFLIQGEVTETVNMVVLEDVEAAGWLRLFTRSIGNFFSGIWNGIIEGITGWFT